MKRDRDGSSLQEYCEKVADSVAAFCAMWPLKGEEEERAFGCLFALLFGTKSTAEIAFVGHNRGYIFFAFYL